MSKPEKRYFKVFSSRHVIGDENNYQRLFDAIDKQDVYDESKIMGKFAGEAFIKRFSIAKSRLYQSILKSMDAYYSNSSVEAQLKRQIHSVEILYQKSLYDQAFKLLRSARKVAEKYQKITTLIEIGRWEKRLIEKDNYEGIGKRDLKRIQSEDENLVQKLSIHHNLWNIKSKVFHNLYVKGKARSNKDLDKFKRIVDKVVLKNTEESMLAENQYLLNHLYSAYFYGVGNLKKCYPYLQANLNLIEKSPHLFQEEPSIYMGVLTNAIHVSSKIDKVDEGFMLLEKLRSLPKLLDEKNSEHLEMQIFAISTSTELALHAHSGRFEEGLELIPKIEEGLLKYADDLSSVRKAGFFFNIAVLCFGADKLHEALKWINELLNNIEIDTTQDLHCMAQIFNLVIHLELGNKSLLPYTLRSTQRYLETRNKVYRFESLFLQFINALLKKRREESDAELYQHLFTDLDELKQDPFERVVFEYFDFHAWAQSKIEGVGPHRGRPSESVS
jgi:hypothetical protein